MYVVYAFCVRRKSLRSLSSAHEKCAFIILFSVYIYTLTPIYIEIYMSLFVCVYNNNNILNMYT